MDYRGGSISSSSSGRDSVAGINRSGNNRVIVCVIGFEYMRIPVINSLFSVSEINVSDTFLYRRKTRLSPNPSPLLRINSW